MTPWRSKVISPTQAPHDRAMRAEGSRGAGRWVAQDAPRVASPGARRDTTSRPLGAMSRPLRRDRKTPSARSPDRPRLDRPTRRRDVETPSARSTDRSARPKDPSRRDRPTPPRRSPEPFFRGFERPDAFRRPIVHRAAAGSRRTSRRRRGSPGPPRRASGTGADIHRRDCEQEEAWRVAVGPWAGRGGQDVLATERSSRAPVLDQEGVTAWGGWARGRAARPEAAAGCGRRDGMRRRSRWTDQP